MSGYIKVCGIRFDLDDVFKTDNGIPFDESYSYDGVHIIFKPAKGTPKEEITAAIKQMKHDRDLVGYSVQYQEG